MDKANIQSTIRTYLPNAGDTVVEMLVQRIEHELDKAGKDIVRKVIARELGIAYRLSGVIDTRI